MNAPGVDLSAAGTLEFDIQNGLLLTTKTVVVKIAD